MKTVSSSLRLLALAFTLVFSTAVMAGDKKDVPATSTVALKVISNTASQPVFELSLGNAVADNFLITIKDEDGVQLYSSRASGTNITRKFMFNEEVGDAVMYVTVKSTKSNHTDTYKISRNYSFSEAPVVTSIK